jgi:exo-1,4-beta-D-glucosaminidase
MRHVLPATVSGRLLAAVALALTLVACGPRVAPEHTVQLTDHWTIQAAAKCTAQPEVISTPGFDTTGWYPTSVPATVLAALVGNGVYKDPFFGKNLEAIDKEQFTQSWWYRTEFTFERDKAARNVRLVFEGINYRADVWLNGTRVASRTELAGAYRVFDLDVTSQIRDGANALAVEVFPPQPGEFTVGFVDWNPRPPDRSMGIFRPVQLRVSGPVALDAPFVTSSLDLATLASATLAISATLTNHDDTAASAEVAGRIGEIAFTKAFALQPRERKQITLTAEEFPQLKLDHPKLWWPNNLGEPNLYELELEARVGRRVSDRQRVTFGVRTVSDYFNEKGVRGYKINGKPLLIRGGGWVDDLFLREDPKRLEAEFAYARHMNLNTIRLEGFWGSSQQLYDLADRYGILLMAGWSCQWEWENYLGKPVDETFGGVLTPEDIGLVVSYLRDQVTWLRNHPSVFVWVLGSDMLPKPELEQKSLALLKEIDPTRPALSACSVRTSAVTGPTGVKMNGPYDYVTPNYWYEDTTRGGAYGFNTETGPGPQPPPLDSLQRMLPAEHLWPIDDMWNYHCARGEFGTLDRYLNALEKRYGRPTDLDDFVRKAQLANYEAIRPMFEAFAVNRPVTTGIIQWMYNAAWPKLFWQLYDYYLVPSGATYGTRVACQPRSVIYDYGRHAVFAVNTGLEPLPGATVEVKVLDLNSKIVAATSHRLDLPENSSVKVADLPPPGGITPVYFVDLLLKQGDGTVASNFYWLSTRKDVLDPEGSEWFVTPNKAFADFTALADLPAAAIRVESRIEESGGTKKLYLKLANPSPNLAFFIELRLFGEQSGQAIVPVWWDDNYLSLLPGEERQLTATFAADATRGERPVLRWSGWNVAKGEVTP